MSGPTSLPFSTGWVARTSTCSTWCAMSSTAVRMAREKHCVAKSRLSPRWTTRNLGCTTPECRANSRKRPPPCPNPRLEPFRVRLASCCCARICFQAMRRTMTASSPPSSPGDFALSRRSRLGSTLALQSNPFSIRTARSPSMRSFL